MLVNEFVLVIKFGMIFVIQQLLAMMHRHKFLVVLHVGCLINTQYYCFRTKVLKQPIRKTPVNALVTRPR